MTCMLNTPVNTALNFHFSGKIVLSFVVLCRFSYTVRGINIANFLFTTPLCVHIALLLTLCRPLNM
jgi:hypothetical protein